MHVDQEALFREFASFRTQLKSYILRMTASVHDTEDIVQDTYVRAQLKLTTYRGESTLKTWVFTIATNLTRDFLRAKKRWPETVTDICKDAAQRNPIFFSEAMQIRESSPQGKFEIKEHIDFCFTCVSRSLPLEQQLVIFLREVYAFSIREVAQILGQSLAMAKYHLHQGRAKMIEVFDQRCSLINKTGVCHQCTELNGIFNPKQKEQEELVKIKMVKDAEQSDKERLFDLRMTILEAIDPFESSASELQLHHLEHNRKVMEDYLKKE